MNNGRIYYSGVSIERGIILPNILLVFEVTYNAITNFKASDNTYVKEYKKIYEHSKELLSDDQLQEISDACETINKKNILIELSKSNQDICNRKTMSLSTVIFTGELHSKLLNKDKSKKKISYNAYQLYINTVLRQINVMHTTHPVDASTDTIFPQSYEKEASL